MGTITSGIGLISGMNIEQLVAQLLAIDARPRDTLLTRIGGLDAQRTALLDLSARIAGILSRVTSLSEPNAFNGTSISSSNPDLLSVSGGANAPIGSYSLIVRQLAATHQVVSRGFASRDAGLPPGTLTIESAQARIDRATRLDDLHGGAGVQRGKFKLTDAGGSSATININDAATLAEVVERINEAGLDITAEVRGDQLVLTETTGGAVRIAEVNGGNTARDLGFAAGNTFSADGELSGSELVYLTGQTQLTALNDGNGVRRAKAGGDFSVSTATGGFDVDLSGLVLAETRIERLNHGAGADLGVLRITTTDDEGVRHEHEVDLSGLKTIGEIKSKIETDVPDVKLSLSSSRLILSYADGASDKALKIADVSGNGARDLGLLGESAAGKINGRDILSIDRLQDVLLAVNFAAGNDIGAVARLEGKRLVIEAGGGAVQLNALGDSHALTDLGFSERPNDGAATGGRVIGGIDSVLLRSLNGGRGYNLGTIRVSTASGAADVDLSTAETLSEVVTRLNQASADGNLGIEAGYDATGTRLVLTSIDGVSDISVSDVSGTFAARSGLASASGPTVRSDNLQRQYLNEGTLLSSLNSGAGLSLGTVKLTSGAGSVSINFGQGQYRTLGDVISEINSRGTANGVTARINDTGDGLLIQASDGSTLTIADESGNTAAGLNIAGEAADGRIDGSFEQRIEVAGGQTLDDVIAKINERGLAQASVINDGGSNPFRLSLTSRAAGSAGELIVDSQGADFDFITLNRAADARVLLGNDPDGGILVTSSSNTLTNVIEGATLTLNGTADEAVTVNVTEQLDGLTGNIDALVTAFNTALERINELTSYDAETQRRGIFLGDRTVNAIERRLRRLAASSGLPADGIIRRLSQVGIRLNEGKVEFDAEKFKEALSSNRAEVVAFFTDDEDGLAAWMKKELEAITGETGLIPRREDALESQKKQITDRVDQLNALLERKKARYQNQFLTMERALANLQGQQTVLSQLASLASQFTTR